MSDWEDLKDYEGWYQINRDGQIRNIKAGKGRLIGKIKMPSPVRNNYLQTLLTKDGKGKRYYIHRLLGIQYIPNPDNKPEIDHIDRNPMNNSIDNLRWATTKENANNRITNLNNRHQNNNNQNNSNDNH